MDMVPSDKVLKMSDIAIHHGGQNTTVQCIENQVPSIIFPENILNVILMLKKLLK